MKTLKLFNGVLHKTPGLNQKPYISEKGFIIERGALWATKEIEAFWDSEKLNGNDLNKTFHKSWQKIKESSRCELLIEQITHYISTYGSRFQDEMYIPEEVLNVPDLKISYRTIRAFTKEELIEKGLYLLTSGIALKEETVDDIITVLVDQLGYNFTGKEGIRNKEAIVKIADLYNVYPEDPVQFLRYIIFRTTGSTLLIKNDDLINQIKSGSYNPAKAFDQFGLSKLAEIFNRFKPLFLAFKTRCPSTINKISKLSKTHHKPMPSNPLNEVTRRKLTKEDLKWLEKATVYSIFKALSACYSRMHGQESFLYRIRNGKSWVADAKVKKKTNKQNFKFILNFLRSSVQSNIYLDGLKVYIPKGVRYALPTSEKLYVGNIPTGTKFTGKNLAVGIYWKNSWGAHDLDLSGNNIDGKIGWNASYNQGEGSLMYSGDITNAPNGALEYLYADRGLNVPTLVNNNVYSGSLESKYKIIVGKGPKVTKDYMMDPNKVMAEVMCQAVQKNTVLGMLIPEKDNQTFVLLNFGAGHARVSGYSETSRVATKALYEQWAKPLSLKKVLKEMGVKFVDKPEEADFDLSIESLTKDSFINIFKQDHG